MLRSAIRLTMKILSAAAVDAIVAVIEQDKEAEAKAKAAKGPVPTA